MYQYDPEQITFFAKTDARGQQVPFGIKANDRTRHVYVIGKTGMGKSTLLENMAVQDIKNGNGLAFIDPHGQTAETILNYIPEERKDDVLYFAPFDTDNPVSFNVMEDVGADKRHLVVSGLMSVFKKIWVDAWSARMEYILSNTLLALLEYPDSTLLGVNRMLSDKDYRKKVIDNITDPAVKSFWVDEFLKYNERYMQEAGDAIKNKIGQFTSNPLIRNIIGQPHSSFNIREIMDDRKIMIMNLSKGLVGEQNANLLGSMLTTRIYLAAMSRADLTAAEMKDMPNFYFYVDEFQSFANATFADILSEARKYKLNLTIAHQYIEQMEEEVRNAVFGNVGTIISFRVGPFDAEVLETVYTPKFLAPDIVNLGFAQIYLTLMIDGIGSTPFSATTLPPIAEPEVSCKDIVIVRSREQFSQKREGVEEKIHGWHAQSFSDKPPYVPKHLREKADGGTLPNTGENKKKFGEHGASEKKTDANQSAARGPRKDTETRKPFERNNGRSERPQHTTPRHNGDRNHTEVKKERPQSDNREAKKEKNLDELRSILKGIAKPEDKKDTKETKNDPKAGDKNSKHDEKKKPSENDLKNVLAAALGTTKSEAASKGEEKQSTPERSLEKKKGNDAAQAPQQKKEQHVATKKPEQQRQPKTPSDIEAKSVQKEVVAKTSPQRSQKDASKPQAETVPPVSPEAQEYAHMKNIDDPLAPKKLERMMRVTGGDTFPLK